LLADPSTQHVELTAIEIEQLYALVDYGTMSTTKRYGEPDLGSDVLLTQSSLDPMDPTWIPTSIGVTLHGGVEHFNILPEFLGTTNDDSHLAGLWSDWNPTDF
jgi:hypothetical protein